MKNLSKFEAASRKINRATNILLFVGLVISWLIADANKNGYLNIPDSILIVGLIIGMGLLIVFAVRKKNGLSEEFGLRCKHCGYLPPAFYASDAYSSGKCRNCGNSYT